MLEAVATLLKRDTAIADDKARRAKHFATVVPAVLLFNIFTCCSLEARSTPQSSRGVALTALFTTISDDAGLTKQFLDGTFSDGDTAEDAASIVATLSEDTDPSIREAAGLCLVVIRDKLGVAGAVVAAKAPDAVEMDSTPD